MPPFGFSNKSHLLIQESFMDWFEVLTFERDRMTGEVEGKLTGFVELDGDKIGVREGPSITGFEDDIQSDGSPRIGRTFRGQAECREIGLG